MSRVRSAGAGANAPQPGQAGGRSAGTTTIACPTASTEEWSPYGCTPTATTQTGSSNRAENVREIAPGDPDFEVLYRRRNGCESINRHLDDTLWLRRAHSVGHRRQLLNLITYALGVNGRRCRSTAKASPRPPRPDRRHGVTEVAARPDGRLSDPGRRGARYRAPKRLEAPLPLPFSAGTQSMPGISPTSRPRPSPL